MEKGQALIIISEGMQEGVFFAKYRTPTTQDLLVKPEKVKLSLSQKQGETLESLRERAIQEAAAKGMHSVRYLNS